MKNQSLKSSLKITSILFFCSFILLALRPVPSPNDSNCQSKEGIIVNIKATPEKDIFFEMQNEESFFYINRGLELNLDVENLKSELLNQNARITFVDHWTPLDPFKSNRSIAQLELQNKVLFSRITQ